MTRTTKAQATLATTLTLDHGFYVEHLAPYQHLTPQPPKPRELLFSCRLDGRDAIVHATRAGRPTLITYLMR